MRIVIALPVLDEEKVLESTIRSLRQFVDTKLTKHAVIIVIADNGSSDGTEKIGRRLADAVMGVRYLRLNERGKGLAIKEAWASVEADAYVFMDADLAVDLADLPGLVGCIEGGAGLCVGSRYLPKSVVRRTMLRKLLSRGYRAVVGAALETGVSDMPCGFKAVSAAVVRDIVPQIKDTRWFFDTELVIRAERAGHRVEEVAVKWHEQHPEGRQSRVRIIPLVKEYVARVSELRSALGPKDKGGRPGSLLSLLFSISRQEYRLLFGAATVAAVIGLIPPLLAAWSAHKSGVQWTGRQFLSPGDMAVYLSYIAQAKAGHVLFENFATTEHLMPVFNILWLKVGWFARLFGLTPLAAFHAVRTLYIYPLAVAAYFAFAYVFRGRNERAAAFLLFMFSSGVGLYAAPFLRAAHVTGGNYQWPIDFWVAESNTFMTILYSPHFIASLLLIVATALLFLMALDTKKISYGVWAGLAGLVLFEFHPFHAPTLYAVALVTLALRTKTDGFKPRQWIAAALFFLLSAPSVAYYYWLTHWTPNAAFMLQNNVTTTPSIQYVLIGLGVIVPLAVFGWFAAKDGKVLAREHRQFFTAWAIVQLALLYSPLVFQRRLVEGLQFPLTVLAIPALFAIVQSPRFKRNMNVVAAALLIPVLFLPSTFSTVKRSIEAANPSADRDGLFFLRHPEAATMQMIRTKAPEDFVVLCAMSTGNDVIGWGEHRTYIGHWANTVDVARKQAEVADFFGKMDNDQRAEFARTHGIDVVIFGPAERAYGGAPIGGSAFSLRAVTGTYSVYAVTR